ncbi:MAG TPA: hypothetical protein VIM75_12495 [Ohtaekwangia sp.]|uniref:hypothetical protein n=1 Tax=Ohtaekwangia sp. TaxID=2066019 RepID=UPI002F925D5A
MKLSPVLLTSTLAVGVLCCGHHHKAKIPAGARQTLHTLYPKVSRASWKIEDGNYEASFHYEGKEASLVLTADGVLLEKEIEIPRSALPAAVLTILRQDYADYTLEEAAILESDGVVRYEAEVEGEDHKIDLIFDADGHLYKKEEKERDED